MNRRESGTAAARNSQRLAAGRRPASKWRVTGSPTSRSAHCPTNFATLVWTTVRRLVHTYIAIVRSQRGPSQRSTGRDNGGEGCDVWTYRATDVAKSGLYLRRATRIGCIQGSQRRYRGTSALRARRNCNLDLNNVASNCPDLLCEPQAGRAVSCNLQPERTTGRRIRNGRRDRNGDAEKAAATVRDHMPSGERP
jgi:hypothetical protein